MSEADDLQRRVEEFADRSLRFIQGLPHTQIAQRMAAQFQDASSSVASNYRAARRGRSYREFTAKIGVVSEEADESVFWLTRMLNAGHPQRRPPRVASRRGHAAGEDIRGYVPYRAAQKTPARRCGGSPMNR